MIKETIRDYAVDAFRFFAGFKVSHDKDKIRAALHKRRMSSGIKYPAVVDAELLDLYAVSETIEAISKMRIGDDILKCLRTVYFTNPDEDLKKGDIEKRVVYCSVQFHLATVTVYRYLSIARRTFAAARGLRTDAIENLEQLKESSLL